MRDTVMGSTRADGSFGIRNYITVIALVNCTNHTCDMVAARTGAHAIHTDYGCGQYEEARKRTELGMLKAAVGPNIYGSVLISLGCQWTDGEAMKERILAAGRRCVHLCVQELGGVSKTVEAACAVIEQWQEETARLHREPCPIRDMVIGLTCGGSDWTSSLSGNNVEGLCADMLSKSGCSFIDFGVRGLPGGEEAACEHACSHEVGERIIQIAAEYRKDVYETTGQHLSEVNPTPGNKAGGISTMSEKALSNCHLRGSVPIRGILEIGGRIPENAHGLYINDVRVGGNDIFVTTAIAMGGAHMMIFNTGAGSPLGNAICPVLKLTGNPKTADRLCEMIDYDASGVLLGTKTAAEAAEELLDIFFAVCEGKETRSELIGDFSYSTPPVGRC